MTRLVIAGCLALVWAALVAGQTILPERPSANAAARSVAKPRALLDQYCVTCHNEGLKTAGLMLDKLDLSRLGEQANVAEKVVRKLRAGMMPPVGMPRPDPATREALIAWLENELDSSGLTSHLPPPGLHRLNRTEYTNVIRDLLGLEVDATKFLPSDDSTHGFDNMAGALGMSPTLMEAYLSAAGNISRLAMGSETAPTLVEFNVPESTSQMYDVEGLPFGTRGGILIKHEFPVDAEYLFKVVPVIEGNMGLARPFGAITGEKAEITVDGKRVHLFDWDEDITPNVVASGAPTPPIHVSAGLHTVGVAFLATHYAPDHNLNYPFLRTTIETGGFPGLTFFPHIGKVRIEGPFNAQGAADTPSRRKIFVCRPTSVKNEDACARQIIATLAKRAFRRPATAQDVAMLKRFYVAGRNEGGNFDRGIEATLQRLLADPEFVYRGETEPTNVGLSKAYRISDLELASRLSFFLWSSIPDEELIDLSAGGKLRNPVVLEQQVRRMLADPRSEALVSNFTGQWLNVRGLQDAEPVVHLYPDFDDNLRQAFKREIELFFASIVHEDRSVLDLLTADYTFVNERLALHYGIPNVYGSRFRRVTLGPQLDMRRGLLGKGALLTVTSYPARTSPVVRGKWFLQTFLGVSPADPPPNVPPVKAKPQDTAGNVKVPTVREQMEEHRANPVCANCHKSFEPIGLAMENFDAVGTWRITDEGNPIDASGQLVDGTLVNGPASLREMLLRYSPQFTRVVTEKLLTYALGRGVEYSDMPLVRSIVRDAAGANYRFSSLVLSIVKSGSFQMNMKEPNRDPQAAR